MGSIRDCGRAVTLAVVTAACACDIGSTNESSGPGNAAAAWATLAEELRIDGYAEDLVSILNVTVGPDETIALDQRADNAVRFYSPEGRLKGVFGSRGQGPGEFISLYGMGWLADTLWVGDFDQPRLTLISPDQSLARMIPLPSAVTLPMAAEGPPWTQIQPYGISKSDEVYASLSFHYVGMPEHLRATRAIARIALNGRIMQLIAEVPVGETSIPLPNGSVALPFPNGSYEAVAPDGTRFAAAHAALEGPNAETILVSAWNDQGDTIFARRYPFVGVPIPSRAADSVINTRLERLERLSGVLAATADAFQRGAYVPPMYPPLSGLLIGRDYSVWLQLRFEGEDRPYLVLEPDGTPLGKVIVTERGRIAEAQRDRIWVIEADPQGVQSVVQYGVSWESGRGGGP